jgi:aryl-alcohol dehydrogenase-like predicted oxidoreductase
MAKQAQLVLGTAQIGLPYGIANKIGLPNERDAVALIRRAVDAGITSIDTARAYGLAEARIGRALRGVYGVTIVTKLDPLNAVAAGASPEIAVAAANASVTASCAALQCDRLDVLLLHRAIHRTGWGGAVWRHLVNLQARGRIGVLGISVQSPAELLDGLTDPLVHHVQLPFNILDWRWAESGAIEALQSSPQVRVHIRSVFLQGLLANDLSHWPTADGTEPDAVTYCLDRLAADAGRQGRADLCVAFVLAQGWIDGVVVGMENSRQLADNLALFTKAPLAAGELKRVYASVPRLPETLLNPALWPNCQTQQQKSNSSRSKA